MNRVTGSVLLDETGAGVPDLVVTVYDVDRDTMPGGASSGGPVASVVAHWDELRGNRLGSVLTGRDGEFVLEYEDPQLEESGPDLLLFVTAPERSGADPAPPLLHVSGGVRQNAGRIETYLIRLTAAELEQAGVSMPSGLVQQGSQGSKAIRNDLVAAGQSDLNRSANQVFKFVSVRPPVSAKPVDISGDLPPISLDRPTRLRRAIAEVDGMRDGRSKATELAGEFLGSGNYVPTSREAGPFLQRLIGVESVIQRLPSAADGAQVAAAIEQEVGESPAQIVASDGFKGFEEDLWDSLYANVLSPEKRPEDREPLFRALRATHLLKLVVDSRFSRRSLPLDRLRSETPLVPRDLFPSVRAEQLRETNGHRPPSPTEEFRKARGRIQSARDEVARQYRRKRTALFAQSEGAASAVKQLRLSGREDVPQALPLLERSPNDEESPVNPSGVRLGPPKPPLMQPTPPWRPVSQDLSAETLEVLEEAGLSPEIDTVPQILDRLDREIGHINARLPLLGKRAVRRVGSSRVYAREPVSHAYNILQARTAGALLLSGGLQTHTGGPPLPPAGRFRPPRRVQPALETPFRVLGIGELLVVRETLLRYVEGEIAHVENVLSGENKTRAHRRKRQIEEVVFVETERVEEQERNLETTERFELQKESERTIETDVSVQAGLSVSASYGTVNVSTTANFAYDNARSESDRSASSYARSVTERALSRIQERVREQRTRRSLEEFEETNTHILDATGRPHVRGVYQWIDKIYSMQIVNYGLRLMLEFVLPEPAAFYIFAQEKARIPGATEEEPIAPEDLGLTSPDVLNAQNVAFYVAAYQIEDVKPPPPERTVIAKAFDQRSGEGEENSGAQGHAISTKTSDDLTVPAGYHADLAFVRYAAFQRTVVSERHGREVERAAPNQGGYIQLGNYSMPFGDYILPLVNEDQRIPLSVITNYPAYILNVEVECEVRPEHLRDWQLETYAAIVAAYKVLKSRYDEQAAQARVRQGIEISGRNPLKNRQIEREELRKGCITLLAGKRFEEVAGIAANTTGYTSADYDGYPEIVTETVPQSSKTIQFLEQAFEWDQMTYQLYPYFWGRKQNWLDIFPLDDADPKFADFLRAGAARVVVPVTPAYEASVHLYLADPEREPFGGGPAPTIDDPLFRSIAAELRRQQGDHFVERDGTLSVTDGSRIINGLGTLFIDGDGGDTNREIRIRGVVYRIQRVVSPTQILLTEPYAGADEDDVPFSVGALLVGQPWTIRVPTSLVYLRDDAPDFLPFAPRSSL